MSWDSDDFDRGYYSEDWDVYCDGDFVESICLDEKPYRGLTLFLSEGAYEVKRWDWDEHSLYCRRDYNYD